MYTKLNLAQYARRSWRVSMKLLRQVERTIDGRSTQPTARRPKRATLKTRGAASKR